MKKVSPDVKSIVLDSGKFLSFYRILSIFKDVCPDLDIRDGIIRQKSGNGFAMLELDITPLIEDISLPFISLNEKLELFKPFQGQEITIESSEKFIRISDRYSSLGFRKPATTYIKCKYIPLDEVGNVSNIADEDLIMTLPISKMISDRIKSVSKVFASDAVTVSFKGKTGKIYMIKDSKEQEAVLVKDIPLDIELKAETVMSVTPFIVDHDGDILFRMYGISSKQALTQFRTTIDDINMTIYHRSTLVLENED